MVARIQSEIPKTFSFLTQYGFGEPAEIITDYEFSYTYRNKFVSICITYFHFNASRLTVEINEQPVWLIELDNPVLNAIQKRYKDYIAFTQTAKKAHPDHEQIMVDNISEFLHEHAAILKRNDFVLRGELDILKRNEEIISKEIEIQDDERKRTEKIYTCYYIWSEIEFYHEAKSLDEINEFLDTLKDELITNITVVDWNNTPIAFERRP